MTLADNILAVLDRATDEHIRVGCNWYHNAHAFASSLDNLHRAAGVIAALSPKNGWRNNMAKAAQLYRQNGDPTNIGMRREVGKAIRIMNGEDALEVLGGHKTRNFFCTIVDPAHDIAVVDIHAHDIAVGKVCDERGRNALYRKDGYALFAAAYDSAASSACLPVSTIQAITWVTWRDELGKGWYG